MYFSRKKGKPTATRTSVIVYFSQKIKKNIKKAATLLKSNERYF